MTDTFRALCSELVDALAEWRLGGGPPEDTADADLIDRARALLAQPVAVGPTDEELLNLADWEVWDHQLLAFARAVLAKWGRPTPQPVAVSERPWERDGWCDEQGRCWWFTPKEGNTEPFRCADWSFYAGWRQKYTHWLPANALPTPEATNE